MNEEVKNNVAGVNHNQLSPKGIAAGADESKNWPVEFNVPVANWPTSTWYFGRTFKVGQNVISNVERPADASTELDHEGDTVKGFMEQQNKIDADWKRS